MVGSAGKKRKIPEGRRWRESYALRLARAYRSSSRSDQTAQECVSRRIIDFVRVRGGERDGVKRAIVAGPTNAALRLRTQWDTESISNRARPNATRPLSSHSHITRRMSEFEVSVLQRVHDRGALTHRCVACVMQA